MSDSAPPPEPGEPYRQPGSYTPYPYGPPPGYAVPHPGAPYGLDPLTGRPLSDKSKVVAGVLQVVLPFGVGRFYTGHVGLGIAQLVVTLVTCGVGALWPFIDGIVILAGQPTDPQGRLLRT
ncbi:TM2 domain-containing protein [Nocardioides panacisoli]|uniref:TM2 domain-containing protein n=1 Tax=Nocardioides panacisoli TaxID=627624 RepID=UPI001C62BAA6|nr:TM2 domain-containing protein [Nocardioides panacisoli]QYJ04647.1 TM2 domain-containing protein [Nocardioides panacisoli]